MINWLCSFKVKESGMDKKTLAKKKRGFLRTIQKANHHIYVFDALLPSDVFENESIKQAIEDAIGRGVQFHVLIGLNHDRSSVFFLETLKKSIRIRKIPDKISFLLADKRRLCCVLEPISSQSSSTVSIGIDALRSFKSLKSFFLQFS
jgi:phosphatidylserine/phosphatidylglycerophosphate/cardiolipin synthase-like enzyme